MNYIYLKGKLNHTFILLHGTGADEYDLLDMAKELDQDAHILSFRGRVVENGMNRFFRRLAPGVFDITSLKTESEFLHCFILELLQKHNLSHTKITVLGYSNGANIALNLILNYAPIFHNAILLKPMPVSNETTNKALTINVFIGAGKNDPLTTVENTQAVLESVKLTGANAELHYYNSGHSVSHSELIYASLWLEQYK